MIINEIDFANAHDLQLGDKLVRAKGIFSKHYGIYVGIHNNVPLVAECQVNKGVRYVSLSTFLLGSWQHLKRVERFNGTEYARTQIIPRINVLLGTQYDLIGFNCEHFAELIQTRSSKSTQVENTLWGMGIAAIVIGLFWNE